MTIFESLKNLNLNNDTVVSLSYSGGTDVFVHNETEVDTALSDTDVVSTFADLVATPGLKAETQYGGNVLESLRAEGLLDDYAHDHTFSEYLAETITDNFYDVEMIEYTTEKYDHKRGFTTVSVTLTTSARNLADYGRENGLTCLAGWQAQFSSELGNMTVDI